MLLVLPTIIQESEASPIVLLQGDSGVCDGNESLILKAYYFPDDHTGGYPTISPVNSFRVIFNKYFGMEWDLLADRSYAGDQPIAS
jgi:hypothetical protein